MSVRTDVVNLQVIISGNKAQDELNTLRKKAADAKMALDGLKRGSQEFADKKKEVAKYNEEIVNMRKQIGLTALTQKELVQELNRLKSMKGSVVPFTKEFNDLDKSIKAVENRLYDVRNGVQGFASFFSKIKDEVKQFGLMAAGYLGFQFLTSQFQNIISGGGKVSDQLADIRRVTRLTDAEAQKLNKSLRELDTRTTTSGLREIAIVAGKLGVAKDDILGFVAATDKLVVALGDELGNADEITTQLGKIINVFNNDGGGVTGEKLLSVGNAIVDLANKGVASGGFIVDFTQRLAGLAKIANVGLNETIGLGAGLEELGQKSESASTAIIKVIGKIGEDVPKYAKIANKSVEEFSETLKNKPIEALIQVSEGLVKNKKSFEEISQAFSAAGEDGARIVTTLGVIGGKADFMRQKINDAGAALKSNTEINDAFALKNETLGATLDKLGKDFNSLMTSNAVMNFLQGAVQGAANFISFLKDLPNWLERNRTALLAITTVILAYAASKTKAVQASILNRTALLLEIAADKIDIAQKTVATAITSAYALAKDVLTGKIKIATAAQIIWNAVMKANPLVMLISVIGGVITAISLLSDKLAEVSAKEKLQNDIRKKAAESYVDEEAKIRSLTMVLNSSLVGYDAKKKALKELIAINPEYLGGLTLENVKNQEGINIINKYIKALREKAIVQAAQSAQADKLKEDIKLQSIQYGLEKKLANGNTGFTDLSEEEKQYVSKYRSGFRGTASLVDKLTGTSAVGEALMGVKGARTKLQVELDQIDSVVVQSIQKTTESVTQKTTAAAGESVKQSIGIIKDLKDKIKKLDEDRETLTSEKAIAQNITKRNALQKQLDRLEQKDSGSGGDDGYKATLKKFRQLEKDLQTDISNDSLKPLKMAFLAINKQMEEEIATAQAVLAKGDTSKAQFDKVVEKAKKTAVDAYQAAYEKFRSEVNKKMGFGERSIFLDRIFPTEKQLEERLGTLASKAPNIMERLTNYFKRDKVAGLEVTANRTAPGSREWLRANKALLDEKMKQELENTELTENEKILIQDEYAAKKADLEWTAFDRYVEYAQATVQVAQGVNDVLNAMEQRKFNKVVANAEKEKKVLDDQLKRKLISQEQYALKIAAIDAGVDREKKKMEREQAKRAKAIALFEAGINVATAITKVIANPVLAVLVGLLGAAQIAAIALTPLPELGKGDWIRKGDKHKDKSGGIHAKIERDEAVMSADAMTNPEEYTVTGTTAQITSALNNKKGGTNWAEGALLQMASWNRNPPPSINPNMPRIMEQGGIVRSINTSQTNNAQPNQQVIASDNAPIVNAIKSLEEKVAAWPNTVKGIWVVRDYLDAKAMYDASKEGTSIKQ